jgi:hypothetical protein
MARAQTPQPIRLAAKRLSTLVLLASAPIDALRSIISAASEELDRESRLELLEAIGKVLARVAPANCPPTVEYAGKLLSDDKKRLDEIISKKINRQVTLAQRVNGDLIGGIRVSVGDRKWEFSISSALRQFVDGS